MTSTASSTDTRQEQSSLEQRQTWQQRLRRFGYRAPGPGDDVRDRLVPPYTEPSGRLLVGTMESIATYHMPPLLEFFHHRYPGLQVVLRPGAGAETVQALRQGSLDLGLLTDVETGHAGTDGVVRSVKSRTPTLGAA